MFLATGVDVEFMRSVEVKICGLTNRDDAQVALNAGADYLGFVLYPKSPRGITALQLAAILDRLQGAWNAVGVFVNERRDVVEQVARDCRLRAVQLHGDEEFEEFKDMPTPVWRALRVQAGEAGPAPNAWPAQRYVVDAAVQGQYGGTGVVADWEAASRLAARWPVMLSGGLTPENVAEAIRIVSPAGVNVSSGVEALPGRKDWEKLRRFIDAARGANVA